MPLLFHWGILSFLFLSPRQLIYAVDATSTEPSSEGPTATWNTILSNSTQGIAFSSAVLHAADVAWATQQPTNAPAIPLPTNITELPDYAAVPRLANALHPVQEGIGSPDAETLIADIYISSNASNSSSSTLEKRQGTMRVMIVGDSMSQGQHGDWTWRYRIWQWFRQNSIAVQMVGPYVGTVPAVPAAAPQPPPLYGSTQNTGMAGTDGGYAQGVDSAWLSDSNHFAVWGRAVAVDKGLIQGVIQQNPADMILLMLGFNDMGWFYSDAAGTLVSIDTFVSNARAANPNLKFAIANVPQRLFIGGRQDLVDNTNKYNAMLPDWISQHSTAQSPIHLVNLEQTYDCGTASCPAGYDGLHPNAYGEFQIASAFSQCLHDSFGMGSGPLTVPAQSDPSLVRPLPVPSNFQVFSSPQGVTATWDAVYGAYSYDVQVSANGLGPLFSSTSAQSNRWDTQWPLDGWTYTVAVRASAGDTRKGDWTNTLNAVARPQLAPPPQNINVQPTSGGFTVTWDPPNGPYTDSIVEYNIIYWDTNPDDCQYISGAAFQSSPAVITGLKSGANYLIAPVTWNANGQGLPIIANNAVVGAGTPATPGGLQVNSNDPTTVHMTWTGSSSAGGYRVWSINVNNATDYWRNIANATSGACNDEDFLFPGVWNYAFAISAFNGNEESARGASVLAPRPASTVTQGSPGPTCPPPPVWCANGNGGSAPPESSAPGEGGPGPTSSGTSQPTPTPSSTSNADDDGTFGDGDYDQCDFTLNFDTLDALNAAAGGLRTDCIAVYSLQTLINMLNTAYNNYTTVNQGYDELFGYYVTYIKNLVPQVAANDFMFDLKSTGQYANVPNVGPGMNYFSCKLGGKNGATFPCSNFNSSKYTQTEGSETTTLTLTDQDGYTKGLATAGLDPDWVSLGSYSFDRSVTAPHGGRKFHYAFTGFPIENPQINIPNPKNIVTQGLGDIPELQIEMQATLMDMMLGYWSGGSTSDPTQAYSVAVFTLMQAIDAMAQAKTIGAQEQQAEEEAEEQRKKNLILLILSVVLIFVPVVGEEVAAAAGLASLARVISILGELGNGALGVYDSVQDPKNAFVNVLGMLFGVGAIAKATRDAPGLSSVANIRKTLSADDITSLGSIFRTNDDTLQNIMKVCRWK